MGPRMLLGKAHNCQAEPSGCNMTESVICQHNTTHHVTDSGIGCHLNKDWQFSML